MPVVPMSSPPVAVPPGFSSQLISRTAGAGLPDAAALWPVMSHDGRRASYAAFISTATDLVAGSGARRNIYLVRRAPPWGNTGTPWHFGALSLATRGVGGAPADGDSSSPALAGNDFRQARCLAFVSSATNLVRGDTNGRPDVFILALSTGRMRRVVTPGPASAVVVDGRCQAYAYVAGGTLYVRDRKGRTRRESGFGGVSHPQLSYTGKEVAYERNGVIVYRRVGGGQRAFGPGHAPSMDGFARSVVFERDGGIYFARVKRGRAHRVATGVSPSLTSGGHAFMYAQGSVVRISTKKRPVASCPTGNVVQVMTSVHANYVVFTCTNGGAYLGYGGSEFGPPPH